jgi:hypothetical protein
MGMNTYTPDVWVVLEFNTPELATPTRKVFGGWYGGYTGSDSWKLNSGITAVRIDDQGHYEFDGYSGSTYHCHFNNYHMSGLMHGVLANWQKQAEQRGDLTIRILSIDEIVVC